MEKYIKEYLLKYNRLQVTDFGVLEIVYKSSYIHPILHTFSVPGKYVVFTESKQPDNDFAFFVAKKERFTVEEAQSLIGNWVQEIRKTINEEKKQFAVSTLGSFFINAMGRIEFAADLDTDISPQSFGLEEFKAKLPASKSANAEEKMDKIDKVGETESRGEPMCSPEKNEDPVEEDLPQKKEKKRIGWWIFLILVLSCGIFVGVVYFAFPKTFGVYKDKALECYDSLKVKISKNNTAPLESIEDTETIDNEEQTIESGSIENLVEPVQEQTQSVSTVQSENHYYVVIGSFRESANADNFLKEKQATYGNAVNLGMGKSGYYMVGIGPYSKQEAETKQKEIPNTWVFKK